MTILRARETQHFLYLFVRCSCGCRFGHRADRRVLVCYVCGRVAELGRVKSKDQAKRKVLADRRRRVREARELTGASARSGHGRGSVRPAEPPPSLRAPAGRTSSRVTAPRRASTRRPA
jgi:hypothetical protein